MIPLTDAQRAAILAMWHALAMTETRQYVEVPRAALKVIYDDFLSDQARAKLAEPTKERA